MGDNSLILYDLTATQPMGSSPVSGGGSYAKRVYAHLISRLGENRKRGGSLKAVALEGKPLDSHLVQLSQKQEVEILFVKDLQKELLPLIETLQADVFFSALPLRFKSLKFPDSIKFIYTIHGLRPFELLSDKYEPLFFYSSRSVIKFFLTRICPPLYVKLRRNDFAQLLQAARNQFVVTVSEHSRYALLSEFPELDSKEIATFYSPVESEESQPDESVLQEWDLEEKGYIMMICGNRWAKNPYRALKALANLKKKNLLEKQVIITGRGRAKYLKRFEKQQGFKVVDYLSAEKLAALYKNAYSFLFPTLNEGFGYPPLECMRHGTPVITSPINSLPELLEDAVLWADPYSIGELEGRLLRIQNETDLHRKLGEKGMMQEKKVRQKQIDDLDRLVTLILKD
ncbi:MAG: glycosyltransferase [Spirochaetales bacterium]|nr:glycosyltransferase [Spirochaetales bacterium]